MRARAVDSGGGWAIVRGYLVAWGNQVTALTAEVETAHAAAATTKDLQAWRALAPHGRTATGPSPGAGAWDGLWCRGA